MKLVGIGGAGCNALMRMAGKIRHVECIALNTDVQDLRKVPVKKKVQLGKTVTKGFGAGMNPEIGRQAAEEAREEIEKMFEGAELVFLTCGLGGGTGTGGAPVVAEIAKSLGALTIAVVTKPFEFEGEVRRRIAEEGWQQLSGVVDAIITVPNEKIFTLISRTTPLNQAFLQIDEVLRIGVESVSDLIARPGLINVDFADIKTILAGAGPSLLGIGFSASGDRAREAAERAIRSPLLDIAIEGARGVLFTVASRSMAMAEVHEAAKVVTESIDPKARVIFGATFDPRLKKQEIKVTVIATGFIDNRSPEYVGAPREISPSRAVIPLPFANPLKGEEEVENLFEDTLKPYADFEEPAFFRKKKQAR
ncbi:MAG: cell division protein FtsZ [Parcubacteria group bacterium]|nr:cell division protein FtsZ [Parcubacteria group bacterium]